MISKKYTWVKTKDDDVGLKYSLLNEKNNEIFSFSNVCGFKFSIYDSESGKIKETNENGLKTQYTYSDDGVLIKVENPFSTIVHKNCDGFKIKESFYYAKNRLVQSNYTTFKNIDANYYCETEKEINHVSDTISRIVIKTFDAETGLLHNEVVSCANKVIANVTYDYNKDNLITERVTRDADLKVTHREHYCYTHDNKLSGIEYKKPNGNVIKLLTFQYDSSGRVLSVYDEFQMNMIKKYEYIDFIVKN